MVTSGQGAHPGPQQCRRPQYGSGLMSVSSGYLHLDLRMSSSQGVAKVRILHLSSVVGLNVAAV